MKNIKNILITTSIVLLALLTISQVAKQKVSPAKMKADKDTKVVVSKEMIQIKKSVPLQAEQFELQVLSEKTDIGKANDILLTIKGSGFTLTTEPPTILINKNLVLKNTEVNEKGTELYVIISKEVVVRKLMNLDFKEAIVSGRKLATKDSGTISISANDFSNMDKSNIVSLKYRKGYFVREK